MKRLLFILSVIPLLGFGQNATKLEYYDNSYLQTESIIKDGIIS